MSGLFLIVDEKGNPIPSGASEVLRMALTGAIKGQVESTLTASNYDAALKAGTASQAVLFDFSENSGRG